MSRNSDAVEWQLNSVNLAKALVKRLKCNGPFSSKGSHLSPDSCKVFLQEEKLSSIIFFTPIRIVLQNGMKFR